MARGGAPLLLKHIDSLLVVHSAAVARVNAPA